LNPEVDKIGEFVGMYSQNQIVVKIECFFISEAGMASEQLIVSFPVFADYFPQQFYLSCKVFRRALGNVGILA
jgi:hypothetical protein